MLGDPVGWKKKHWKKKKTGKKKKKARKIPKRPPSTAEADAATEFHKVRRKIQRQTSDGLADAVTEIEQNEYHRATKTYHMFEEANLAEACEYLTNRQVAQDSLMEEMTLEVISAYLGEEHNDDQHNS